MLYIYATSKYYILHALPDMF